MSAFTVKGAGSKKASAARDESKRASPQSAGTQRRAAAKERGQDPFVQNPGVRSELQLESALNGSQRVAAQRKLASVLSQRKTDPQPNTVMRKGIPVNNDSALETEADEMGAKALQMKEAPSNHQASPSRGVIQRRTSVAGRTIVTGENVGEIVAYINSKQQYDQEQESNRASRRKEPPREIPKLGTLKISTVIEYFKILYPHYSPAVPFEAIVDLLREWANAKGPSEVVTEGSGKSEAVPLVSTQDNSFGTFAELFLALVDNVRAERSRREHEKVAFEVLANLESYLPVLEQMLGNITLRLRDVSNDVVERMVKEGYARFLIRELPAQKRDLVQLIIRDETDALKKLYVAVNTIHSFAVTMKKLAPQRSEISRTMGDRRDKYSPYGPEVEGAREKGLAVWSGFSGSAADILNLAQNFGVSQEGINHLAALTSAFFYFLPTSKNSTHTLHEVMAVANRYFNVPYDPMNPTGTLPHALRLSSSTSEATTRGTIPRVGPEQKGVEEVDIAQLNMLHDVPRKGVSEDNIINIRKMISAEGYNLKYPVSATRLPNGFYLVTGGHHRIAAMKQLGERTVPVKIYSAAQTDPFLMAKMIGIARITGKYHSRWLPSLSDLEKVEVNWYLREWMKQYDNQVVYPFQYTLRSRLFPPTGGLYPNEEDPMEVRKSKL